MKNLSAKVVILIGLLFLIIYGVKIGDVTSGEKDCLCAYDGFGYYMYLPSIFDHNTLYMEKAWAEGLQNKYCDSIHVYQLIGTGNGNYIDIYHMGLAYLELPSYLISHQFALLLDYKTDGFSKPYQIGFLVNALLFIILGLYFIRKLLLLFFKDTQTAVILISFYLASNFLITSHLQYDLPHIYLFALNSIFLFHFFSFIKYKRNKSLIIAACILGLSFAIRPTQVIWGIIPLVYLYREFELKSFIKRILLFPIFAILWNIPQMLYWKVVGGDLILPNLHTEEIILTDPNLIDFLFSFRKGWLTYSPYFILFFVGLAKIYKANSTLFWTILSFSFVYIYIISAWECWWYASSFGARPMVDIYPIILIPVGYIISNCYSKPLRIIVGVFIVGTIILNLFQSYQFSKGYLHSERMSYDHYQYIFGKAQIDNYEEHRLLIDRADVNWIENNKKHYSIKEECIFEISKDLVAEPGQDLTIGDIFINDKLSTDEVQITAVIEYKTSNKSLSSELKLETCSKFNCYDWQNNEISLNSPQGDYQKKKIQFNLHDIRHTDDYLQMYIYNPNNVRIEIKTFKVIAKSAIRTTY